MAIRHDDVSGWRLLDKARYWQHRAAKHFRLSPVTPVGIPISSLPELIESVARHYPLVTIHPEKKTPGVCYIGPLLSMTKRKFTISDLSSEADWTGPRRMKFDDVTRVDFGGGYEDALAVTAPKMPKHRKRIGKKSHMKE